MQDQNCSTPPSSGPLESDKPTHVYFIGKKAITEYIFHDNGLVYFRHSVYGLPWRLSGMLKPEFEKWVESRQIQKIKSE